MAKLIPPLLAVFVSACAQSAPLASATEAELCRQWGGSLPTRSRSDTEQTKGEIQRAYAAFSLACPDWKHLIP